MCLVDLPSGRLSQTEFDFSIPGPIPLTLERHYRSTHLWPGDLGYGWGHTLGVQLWREGEGQVVYRGSDGRRIDLVLPANSQSSLNEVERTMLQHVPAAELPWRDLRSELPAGALVVQPPEGFSQLFDAHGRDGKYIWRGIADRSGNLVHVHPDKSGLPQRLRDGKGRILELTRDASGLLIAVHLADAADPEAHHLLVRFDFNAARDLIAAHDAAGTRTYTYDLDHRLIAHTDRCGGACTTVYDSRGYCRRTSRPDGVQQKTFSYDPRDKTATIQDSLGHPSQFVFIDPERVVRSVDEAGNVSLFEYDEQGRMRRAIDQMGNATVFGYDARGAQIGKVDPTGAAAVVQFDGHGEVARLIAPSGAVREYQRDPLGRVVSVSRTGHGTCQIAYDAAGEIASVVTPFGKKITVERSPNGRQVVEADPAGVLTTQQLDLFGRLTESRDANGATTRYQYDPAGRLVRIQNPDATTRTFRYDPEGRLTGIRDEEGAVVTYQYDRAGRRVKVQLPDGKVLRCEYDPENRITGICDVDGLWHRYTYDARGLVARQQFTDGREEQYLHDPRGLIAELLGPGGTRIKAERDPAGRLKSLEYSDGRTKAIEMDESGSWVRVASNGHVLARELTEAGQPVVESVDDFSLHRVFGDAGELLSVTDSLGHQVRFAYDGDGRIVEAIVSMGVWRDDEWEPQGTPRVHAFQYDRVGNLLVWEMPGGKVETRRYDSRRRMVEQTITRGEQLILRREYEYDGVGRVRVVKDSRRGRSEFTYGLLGELRSVSRDGGELREFHYDARGNLSQDQWSYDPGHRLRSTGQESWDYDERGFVVRRRVGQGEQRYDYSDHGLLRRVRGSHGSETHFEYDAHSRLVVRRAAGGETRFFWDGDHLWGYASDGDAPTWFLRFPRSFTPLEQCDGRGPATVHADPLGRVWELIDDAGQVVWENTTDVWGVGRAAQEGPPSECLLGLPGQLWESESELYYNRYRWYVAETARYLTPDPVGIWSGMDAYRYVLDPVNFQDPLGLKCRGKNDDPELYRSDSRPPSVICQEGFKLQNPSAGLTLAQHVEGVPAGGSNWVSTTHSRKVADDWMGGGQTVYKIDNPGCGHEADCDPDLMAKYGADPPDSEHEIAFNKDIPPKNIAGWFSADPAGGFKFNACP